MLVAAAGNVLLLVLRRGGLRGTSDPCLLALSSPHRVGQRMVLDVGACVTN